MPTLVGLFFCFSIISDPNPFQPQQRVTHFNLEPALCQPPIFNRLFTALSKLELSSFPRCEERKLFGMRSGDDD